MKTGRARKWSRNGVARRFAVASAIVVGLTAAFLPGSGLGSSATAVRGGQLKLPTGLAAAIHARLGSVAVQSSAAADAPPGPALGGSVSLSADGTTALVGAPFVAGGKGAAYIFHASAAGSWTSSSVPTATLTSKHSTGLGAFGISVALSADGLTAFVGAPFNGGGLFGAGAIYVFHASAEDAWATSSTPAATLTANHGIFVGFALGLSADGTTLVAGAPFYNTFAGGAYVFHASSEGAWASTSTPAATLSVGSESEDDGAVGASVAISGDGTTVLLGDGANPSGGGAFLYHVAAENAWTTTTAPTATLTDASISGKDDGLGSALALSSDGTVALLGAPGVDSNTGVADVFYNAVVWTSTATPTASLTVAGGSAGDGFGVNVALAPDGKAALVFAAGHAAKRGAGYIFSALSEATWTLSSTPTATLTDSGGHPKDLLGIGGFSLDGATVLAGAPGVNLQTGAAKIFHVLDESSWTDTSSPDATLTDKALAACVVPKLKGLKLAAAKSALGVGRCRLGKVKKVHAKTKKSRGRVLSQNRKAGRRLAINAKVNVRVGK